MHAGPGYLACSAGRAVAPWWPRWMASVQVIYFGVVIPGNRSGPPGKVRQGWREIRVDSRGSFLLGPL